MGYLNKMDEHFKKEYEKKKDKASKEYLNYIHALSLIDGSHKQHLKVMKNGVKYFKDVSFEWGEKKTVKIVVGKSWVDGFSWALKHIDILTKLNSEVCNSSQA